MSELKTLFEKFEIVETLKKDSQTGVYLANHIYLNKKIILKSLDTSNLIDQAILHRFKREAKILAQLDHPNIIKVLDFGTYQNYFYISFEYFQGESLRNFLKKKKLDLNEFETIVAQILLGLDYAHSQKIIHRDLKPDNILIDSNLKVKIADFGLALSEDEVQVTRKESIVGTPGYMSPEQIRGEELTASSDIFSLGIILFEMLIGSNPFIGKDITTTINNILFLDREVLEQKLINVPEKWSKIILRCLEKSIDNRYKSISEISNDAGLAFEKSLTSKDKTKFELKFSTPIVLSFSIILILAASVIFFIEESAKEKSKVPSLSENPIINEVPNTTSDQKISEQLLKNQKQIEDTKNEKLISTQKLNESNQTELNTVNSDGELFITCSPWADIYINDEKIETTPLQKPIKLKTGKYQLKLIHPNFPPIDQTIEIQPDKLLKLDFNFYENFGYIEFQIIPWGEVKINNKNYGTSPFQKPVILNPGKQILTFHNPKFGYFIDTIFLQKGETLMYRLNFNNVKTLAQ
ncbi:MAG: serine/threonine-protein kinase [Ignavibacteria bacterium]